MIVALTDATVAVAGPKAAALGVLVRAGFPVPAGFVVPAGIEDLTGAVAEGLAALGDGPVAVRSSAAGEDTAGASAAGQYESFLGVQGVPAVIDKILATRESLWSDRAVAYRDGRTAASMAVIVQQHVDADVAGVLFTVEGGDSVIEASWGLGESVVQGLVTPDAFAVGAEGVAGRRCGGKRTRIDCGPAGPATSSVPPDRQQVLCLTDEELQRLHQLGQEVAAHLGGPQDIEFAVRNGQIWLLQARPATAELPLLEATTITAARGPADAAERAAGADCAERPESPLLRGTPGSPGTATGPARVVHGPEDFSRVQPGDVLVCRFTDPTWTPLFGVVSAVVTETGGRLCHAAIVARERRIPAVLGIPTVLTAFADGQPITVDGTHGTVG
ncbi:pyruvate, phosphate dikinase [Kribbella sp. ALI-6-A]|uniref:PEP/pyruvate-binding domain-containing protein n=1 Tax=Kribbella sp. ALI-6-A TaxID=1933817 RepID=UPI00097C9B70|nr:PEP/pyruvate-binding domain-containing protein [Kribbella sp. ALI-6-A]ONI69674.1 pyruvate, phosphate dikinase [Kribbella sp. ALI-6-A]